MYELFISFIYLNVNRVLVIHYENMLKIYPEYTYIILLFHSILKITFLILSVS
jgi:hypothetical protein